MSGGVQRVVQISARDRADRLLPGTTITWTEDGDARGTVEAGDGHAILQPADDASTLGVTATYRGARQQVTLASTQSDWTFVFDVTDDEDDAPKRLWREPAVVAAVIAAAAALIVGYWQFVAKPGARHDIVLSVRVIDAATRSPVRRAEVVLHRPTRVDPRTADDYGNATFDVDAGVDRDLVVTAVADGYEAGRLDVGTPSNTRSIEFPLQPKRAAAAAPSPSGATRPTPGLAPAPAGTWAVTLAGDLALQRIKEGRLAFSPQSDGRILVSGSLRLDGSAVRLTGTATRQGRQVFVEFAADGGGASWNGRGSLQQVAGDTLDGTLTDADGRDVPVKLRKP